MNLAGWVQECPSVSTIMTLRIWHASSCASFVPFVMRMLINRTMSLVLSLTPSFGMLQLQERIKFNLATLKLSVKCYKILTGQAYHLWNKKKTILTNILVLSEALQFHTFVSKSLMNLIWFFKEGFVHTITCRRRGSHVFEDYTVACRNYISTAQSFFCVCVWQWLMNRKRDALCIQTSVLVSSRLSFGYLKFRRAC